MGIRKILTDKDPALHKVCRNVEKFDWRLHKLLDDMRDTLIESNGVGLAAPQVGILRRVVLVDTGDVQTAYGHFRYIKYLPCGWPQAEKGKVKRRRRRARP